MATVNFIYKHSDGDFSYKMSMEDIPRPTDRVVFPNDGEFKVTKTTWIMDDEGNWEIHLDLRKPFTSEW